MGRRRVALAAAVLAAMTATAAWAHGARAGYELGHREGLLPEPGGPAPEREPDRPEGRRLRRAPARLQDGDADRSRRERLPARAMGERRLRDGKPGLLADQHVHLQPVAGRVRAGDGLLLGHAGAAVHPAARLRVDPTPRQRRVSGHQDQPVRSRQLVLDEPSQGRDPVRQGRRRRRGGRGGDPPRVRPRDPGRAGRRTSAARPKAARSERPSATTGP